MIAEGYIGYMNGLAAKLDSTSINAQIPGEPPSRCLPGWKWAPRYGPMKATRGAASALPWTSPSVTWPLLINY